MPMNPAPSFERWIEHAFDHPESDLKWWQRPKAEYWRGEPALKAEYIAETFEHADEHLARFSDAQIESALWHIIGEDYAMNALGGDVPLERRLRVIGSTYDLFRKLFAVRCRDLIFGGGLPVYGICYMFWELFPLENTPSDPEDAPLCEKKIAVLERILDLDNAMCQYSALHGLGHAQSDIPERTAEIIDRYLARHPEPDFPLRAYALGARKGCVM